MLEAFRAAIDIEVLQHVEQCLGGQRACIECVLMVAAEQHRQFLAIPRRLAALVQGGDGLQTCLLAGGWPGAAEQQAGPAYRQWLGVLRTAPQCAEQCFAMCALLLETGSQFGEQLR